MQLEGPGSGWEELPGGGRGVGAAAALRNRARVVVSRGASEVLAALCAELGRGGVVAYKC